MSATPLPAGADLADVEVPKAHRLQPRNVGLVARVYATAWLHRLVPTATAIRLAQLRGTLEWYAVPERRRAALERAEITLGVKPETAAARRWARRQLREHATQTEFSWRPWLAPKLSISGFEHLEAARAAGRGVIVASIHVGPVTGLIHGLAARGLRLYVSGGHRPWEPLPDGYVGLWTAVQNRWVEEGGCRWVFRGGSHPILRALLERGDVCLLMFDVPGRGEASPVVELAGKRVRLARGIGSLARETGAAVVPSWVARVGTRQVVHVGEAVDAAAFPDEAELMQGLADVFSEPIRAYGEQAHPRMANLWSRGPGL